jgi:hypothetical protein
MVFRKFPEFFMVYFSSAAFGIMLLELPFFFEFRFPVILIPRADTKRLVDLGKGLPGIFILYH